VPKTLDIPGLPETLRDPATKLYSYGFTLKRDLGGVWTLTFPPGDKSGYGRVGFTDNDLASGLLRVLRGEEEQRGILHRYEQFDTRWSRIVYGHSPGDTTIAAAGCGPTSLSIVLQYLMNNGSRPRSATYSVAPPKNGRLRGYTRPCLGARHRGRPDDSWRVRERWPEFDGSRVTLDEAAALLEEGKLIVFLCHGCRGYSRNRPLHRQPDVSYGGHYMVLAGVESQGPTQIFYVVDPGRNAARAMRFITRFELSQHAAGFWWVYRRGEPETRASGE